MFPSKVKKEKEKEKRFPHVFFNYYVMITLVKYVVNQLLFL